MSANETNRRQTLDRRNTASRRRHADTRSLHIELCHSVLRVAIVIDEKRGEQPKLTTQTVRWRQDAPDLRCNQGLVELSAALRQLVATERLAGCRVSFAISSTLCVNRASSGASARVEEEVALFVERSQLYLSLGHGPKITAVGRKQIDARHEHALVTVANEETIYLLVQAAETAGLVVDVVESSLVALSRLHGRLFPNDSTAVLLAQLDEEKFEIGVSRQGELLLEYRPSSVASIATLGKTLDEHHDRLQRFCRRQYGLGTMSLDRMWLVGDPEEVRATNATTDCHVETGVLPLANLSEHWGLTDSPPPTAEMGAVLGQALRSHEDSGINPNLMEKIHACARTPVGPFLVRALIPIAASVLGVACLWAYNLEQSIEIAALQSEAAEMAPLELKGKRLSKQIVDADLEIDYLSQLTSQVPPTELGPLVDKIAHCLPEDVWLKHLRVTDRREAILNGISYTEGGVYDLVHHLEQAPQIPGVALRGTGEDQTPEGPATTFDLELTLSPLLPETPDRGKE